eukprot:8236716-Pyramimonas_sp.AAC.1
MRSLPMVRCTAASRPRVWGSCPCPSVLQYATATSKCRAPRDRGQECPWQGYIVERSRHTIGGCRSVSCVSH